MHVRNFENVEQLFHQLILLDKEGFEPYRDMARQYLSGKRVPTRKLKRSALKKIAHTQKPRDLVQHVVREVESHKDPSQKSQLGGGVFEAAHTVTHELLHLVGANILFDKIFGIQNPNKPTSYREVESSPNDPWLLSKKVMTVVEPSSSHTSPDS